MSETSVTPAVPPTMEKVDNCPQDYKPAYWSNEGKYESLYEELWNNLVPSSGECLDKDGKILDFAETFRKICRLYYDLYNNGLCNDYIVYVHDLLNSSNDYRDYFEHNAEFDNWIKFLEFAITHLNNILGDDWVITLEEPMRQ